MNQSRVLVATLPIVLAMTAVACGAAPPRAVARTDDDPNRLYPLSPGRVWSYDIDTGERTPVLGIVRVVEARADTFVVSAGGDPILYERRPNGILRVQSDTYLLRRPIALRESWPAASGRTATITAIGVHVEVPAGTFDGCVEVTEQGGEDELTVETTYCTDVGAVIVDSIAQSPMGGPPMRTTARLRGFAAEELAREPEGENVNVPVPPPPPPAQ